MTASEFQSAFNLRETWLLFPSFAFPLPDTQQTAVAQRTDTTDRLRSPRKADTDKITEPFSTDFLTHDESVRF